MSPLYLPFTLTLRSRAVITGIGGDPNSAATLHYVPGSSMRGVFAARVTKRSDAARLLETIILSDAVRYLNAYPLAGSTRTFPLPASWRPEKHDRSAVHDLAAGRPPGETPPPALGGGLPEFVTLTDATLRPVRVWTSAQIHQQRDRVRGRAWRTETDEGLGTIFVYESIDAGQAFGGVIAVPGEAEARQLRALVPDGSIVQAGRSRASGYGGESILEWGSPRDRESDGASMLGVRAGERFRLVLASHYIGRDEHTGQVDPEALTTELARRFGDAVRIASIHWSFDRAAAFNRTWQLRLPEVPVVRAGSVVILEAKKDLDDELLAAIEHEGLGERRNEGFGRLLFLPAPTAKVSLASADERRRPAFDDGRSAASDRALPAEARALLTAMEGRILAERAGRSIEIAAAGMRVQRIPPRSLLGRLLVPLTRDPRAALQTLSAGLRKNDPQALRDRARHRLDECRILIAHRWEQLPTALQSVATGPTNGFETLIGAGEVIRHAHLLDEESARRWFAGQLPELRRRLIVRLLASMQKESAQLERKRPGAALPATQEVRP